MYLKISKQISSNNVHKIDVTSCLLYLYTHSDCRMTKTSCLLYLYTHSDCRMTKTSCLLYLYTHSDCRMTRTSCLLYLYTYSDCRMTKTSCLLYLYTHSDCPAYNYNKKYITGYYKITNHPDMMGILPHSCTLSRSKQSHTPHSSNSNYYILHQGGHNLCLPPGTSGGQRNPTDYPPILLVLYSLCKMYWRRTQTS